MAHLVNQIPESFSFWFASAEHLQYSSASLLSFGDDSVLMAAVTWAKGWMAG
jgi:hypothetical protein